MLGEDEKQFLKLWDKMSPYNTSAVMVVNDKKGYMIYFTLEGFDGNIGRYEYHGTSSFYELKDKELYRLKDLIQ